MVLEGFRISPQQDRIWSLDRGARHRICGNRCAIRIQGELDRAALTVAWRSLVERHEILRIQLHPLPGLTQPVQAATGGDARWLPDRDFTGLGPEPIAELLDELGREPFADDRGPSAVLSLLCLGEREHVLLLALPAFQSDAVGLRNVVRDLALCYAAVVEGRPLEDEPLPYTGAADWLLELLQSEEAEAGKKRWSRIDLSPMAELRLPREARPAADADPAAAIGTVALELGHGRLARLDELADRLRVAPETFLLACWQAFLARSTRQGRGLVGVAFTGRTDEELEVALGPFARVLPVPWGIEPETPLSVVVQALETELDEARQWQECFTWKPLERAVEKLGVEPFFPYAFEAVSLADRFPAAGVTFSVERVYSCTDRFALRLFAVRRPEGLRLEIQHDRTRCAPAEAGRWADRFATFLDGALATPEAAVDDLEMVSAAEREHLLRDYNRTAAGLPLDRCLHEHFEAQAERSPAEVAVEHEGVELSYAELNARANQLAHYLRDIGTGPESLVGICLDRSIKMVVALLGVLKAGAAWLPLDPGYPADRLTFMLEDARSRALLTLSGTRDDIAARADRVLVLDRMEEELARHPRHNPATWTGSDALAYMIYTSGSTGHPKGVMVRHRSIANRLLWMLDLFPLAADDRVLFKTPFSFDASIWEIFVPLFAGARLVVARPGGHQDPSYLVRTVIDREITVLQLVPSLLRMVLDEPGFPACRSLRRLFSGGEALTGDLVERFYASGLTAGLHNLYGPTEVAIDATCWSCRRDDARGAVPIGHPIANAEVYLLDAAGRVVPEGMSGELHVGGVGPARGYHRRPELTAERFLPDACSGRSGDRLYKTGDLARYREDGSLEFLGRIDHQVKVRGFRIELGEIEARLRSHPRVHQSVVVARRDEQGRDRLVAYVVPRHRAAVEPGTPLYRLPNGIEITHLNKSETDEIFTEIFAERSYLRRGLTLRDGDVVFDVGANIGLFSLFVHATVRDARVLAFEPSPPTFEKLRANVEMYGLAVEPFDCGLSDTERDVELTFYPQASARSGVYADAAEEARVTRSFMANQEGRLLEHADALIAGRFEGQIFTRPMRRLSDVLHERGIERIDYLKIDVEKSELDVLSGIDAEDWSRIRQIALEVHDTEGRLARIVALLEEKGFEVAVEQPGLLENTGLYNLYAVHPSRREEEPAPRTEDEAPSWTEELTPDRLRSFLGERLPEHMVPSVFVLVDSLPLSPNGKVDHKALAERPLPQREGERPGVPRIAPASDAERVLAEIWRELLQVDEVSTADNFFELGGDSILCIQIVSRARRAGLWFSPRDLFQNQTIAKLALVAQTAPGPAAGELEGGEIPLTPSQRSFFERSPEDLHHYNQALVLALREKIDTGLLERALAAVVAHHTALRLRYIRQEGSGWSQAPADTIVPLQRMDLSSLPAERRAAALEAVAAQLQASLDIERGPLLRAALFELGEGGQRLFLAAHHLIVDGVSWRILLDDLGTACRAAAEGADIVLPPVITSLRQWGERLAEYARSTAGAAELAYWLALDERQTRPLPVDRESGRDTMVSARHLVAELSEEETRELLRDVPAVYRTRVNDVLLTALAEAFTTWTGAPRLLVDLEGHGREDLFDGVDLSRTVGWLTAVHPVLLKLDPQETDPGERLKSIKEQLRAAPRGGLGYGVLRALGEGGMAERLRARPAAQVIFNYLGQLDRGLPASSLFAPASEPAGPSQSRRQERPWLLEINGGVAGGRLRLIWAYSENRHEAHTIQGVIDRFLGALRALIAHCRTAEAGFTPSDFPEARVSREDLDRLLARLGGRQRDIETLCELSPMQQALLFHSLYSLGSGVYMMQISLRLSGRLDVAAFLRSWQRAIERHGLLRTGFSWEKLEKPLQVVYQHVDLPVERASWGGLDAAEQRARLAAYLDEDRERGFNLTAAPLMRLALFDLGLQEHQLVWTQHHLVSDGWSQGLLLGELFTCYGAFVEGREPSLRPAGSFWDYIAWLQRQDLAEAEAFWRRRLAGFEAPTLLAGGDGRGAARLDLRDPRQRLAQVPAETMAALRELARQNHLTLNTLVQGAWSLLLAQATGEDEVVFGNTVAGRPPEMPGAEAIFGVFINTLPVRVAVDPGLQLLPWLAALQEGQAEAQRYEFAPLSQVQSWSDLPPGVALFDHILVSESYPLDGAVAEGLPGLTISEVSTSELTHYPLSLAFLPGPELLLDMTWDGSRFDTTTVVRLLERLQGLLRAFAEDPRRRLGELPLLLPEERHQLVYEWNESVAPPARCVSFLALFERQVDRAPDAPALSHADGTRLTYGELDRRANRLANRLRRLGAAMDVRVAVLAERSPELIVSLLGILKAGAAYVPLDPGYPPERLAFMLEDSGAAILLTGKRWMDRLPAGTPVPCFLDEGLEGESVERPQREPDPRQTAYVLYTSGSTGRPKGVMVSHGALARFAELVKPLYEIRPGDRVLQFCSISFDISLDEIVSSLSHGAELVLRTDAMLESVAVFLETCRQQAVTVLELPTAYWHEVIARLDTDGLSLPSCLRLVVIGGERALHHRVVAWRRHAPEQTRLLNSYGVTEATISSTWADLAVPSAAEVRGEVSVGRPFPDVDLYLLDRKGEPVPIDVAGELHIGGSLLARGYLNRPDLTAERFVPHPFSPAPGARLYRTGDLARVHPDGALELVGRGDRQVKLRGYRIEVEEIEARLLQHPEVESALVAVREDSLGDKQLVGYLVLRHEQGLDLSRLPIWLRETLPDYMVPSAFVVLEALPLTPNGKVDREALPAPERAPFVPDGMAAPSDPVEELLAGIWAEVLGLGRVGVHDDFFALGGHSLLATQVMSRLRNVLGVELPLRRLFESPTVAALARDVREARQEDPAAPPIVPVPRDRDLPLSFAQQRLWLIDQLDPGSPVYNLPMALRLSGELIPSLLERLFAEIVRRHEALRTTFEVRAGEPVQVIAPPGDPALWPGMPVVDLSHLPGAERETEALALARAEARRPFDLWRGPLLRFALLRLAGSEHVLLMTMHHIVSDGWSMGVLVREVAALHAAFSQGLPSPLPELAVQYADYAVWQRGWLRGATLDDQIDHWKRRLAGAPRVLELPTDRPRPAVETARGALQPVALSSALSERVRELCRREGVTPFMLLLAGWAVLLGRHAGQEDVLVGTPIAGRTRREIEDLIGFFVNTLALRVDWARSEALAFRGLLGQVRETALDAFAHQDLPFERLVEELVPERSLAFSPLVQVLFALQNTPAGALSLPGLSLASVALDSGTSKLDLTLSLGEGPEGFSGGLEHNTDLFDPATAERLATRFAALLEAAVAEPGRAVPDLPLLLPAELEQVLWTWNATRTEYPRAVSLPELFTEVARERPEAPAVVGARGEVWSYGRLDEESNRLARRLRTLGVRPEMAVGLSMERSPELILGILAIVKAGGVYVPLDASYPDERLRFMLEDTAARLVLVHAATRQRLASMAQVLDVEEERTEDAQALDVRVAAASLAYVIYTSGSTGRPKGVAVPHQAIVRLVRATNYAHLGPGDRTAHVANISFDAATWEIWGALLNGGAVAVIPRETMLDPPAFAAALREQRVTSMFLTSALFTRMSREVPDAFEPLSELLVGGEAVDPVAARTALAGRPPCRLLNVYGPTESTTYASWYPIREVPAEAASIPIGFPLANTTLYVLDRWQRPVPLGVTGELLIGGDGLARGYLNRPELTAELFLPHPWGTGERLYRSGDLARHRPDGSIELLGRLDDQVKIRGFRIEPGEIESVLSGHPEVREAAVLARRDGVADRGDTRLVAYVAGHNGQAPRGEVLRDWLRERLPEHMLPSSFVILKEMPLTVNGKLDRRALPAPESTRSVSGSYVAPSNPVEEKLAALWVDLLQIGRVGVDDDFFAIGGHSLLATQVVTQVREALGMELPLRRLFQAPTIRQLARSLSGVLMVRLSGELSVDALERALGELGQEIGPPGDLPVLDLSDVPDGAREEWALQLVLEEGRSVSGDEGGPLLRFGLLRLGPQEHLLLVTQHVGAERE